MFDTCWILLKILVQKIQTSTNNFYTVLRILLPFVYVLFVVVFTKSSSTVDDFSIPAEYLLHVFGKRKLRFCESFGYNCEYCDVKWAVLRRIKEVKVKNCGVFA